MRGSIHFCLPMGLGGVLGRGTSQATTPVSQPAPGKAAGGRALPSRDWQTGQTPCTPPPPGTAHQAVARSLGRYTDRLLFLRGKRCGCVGMAGGKGLTLGEDTETGLLRSLGEHGGRGPVPMELSPLLPAQTPRCQLTPSGVPPDAPSHARLLCFCKAAVIFRLHL